jgi:hypothetical protein
MSWEPDGARLRADVEALAAMPRGSASAGERAAAAWAQGRLSEAGASGAIVEHYRGRTTNSWSFAAHAAAGVLALRVGGLRGALVAAAALWSLERDASGRFPWRRRVLGGGYGANAAGRIEPRRAPLATVLLVAHLDTAKTGLAWHPALARFGAARRVRTRRADPALGPQGAALVLTAAACLPARHPRARGLHAAPAAALHPAAIALHLDIARSAAVPGANDDATGVAAALELTRALASDPPEHTRVVVALVGSEESGMGGFHTFLTARPELASPRTLVVGLDTLGSGTPIVAAAEGALRPHRYRDADLALVDAGAAHAGEPAPERWRIGGWTDPLLALTRGIPAVSLLSLGPDGAYTNYHLPSDVPEHVDWESVAACARIARGIVGEVDRRAGGAPARSPT